MIHDRGMKARLLLVWAVGFVFVPGLLWSQLRIGPYVQETTQTSAKVVWYTAQKVQGVLRFGLSPGSWLGQVTAPVDTAHFVQAENLTPATKYYYEISDGATTYASGNEYYFITHPEEHCTAPFSFMAFGDFGTGESEQQQVVDRLMALEHRFGFALLLGDIVYKDGTRQQYLDNYFPFYQDLIRHQAWWPTLGNHDIRAENAKPYFEFFYTPANNPPHREHYYSLDYGRVHFTCIDGQIMIDPPELDQQLAWVRADLQDAKDRGQRWLIVMWHEAPYSGGTHTGDGFSQRTFVPLMDEFGVDLVLNGHSHVAERTYVIANGEVIDDHPNEYHKTGFELGTVYVISGCGGESGDLSTPNHPMMAFQRGNINGFEIISIDQDTLIGEFISAAGQTLDEFKIIKHELGPLEPNVTLLAPNGNELFEIGASLDITWSASCFTDSVAIDFSTDSGASWETIAEAFPNRGIYEWQVPSEPTTKARIRVSAARSPHLSDMSDADFIIRPPVIALPDAGAYGYIRGGDRDHADEVRYSFAGVPGDAILNFELYDIDQAGEVAITLNEVKIADAALTPDKQWAGPFSIDLPDSMILDDGPNLLVFDNLKNPPQEWAWGVRAVSISCPLELPIAEAYGKIPNGDQSHADRVVYCFPGQIGDLVLSLQAYDIDNRGEVKVTINGRKSFNIPATASKAWSETIQIVLLDSLVNDEGSNFLEFDNTKNPPKNWLWGVREVAVSCRYTLPVAEPLGKIPGVDVAHADRVVYCLPDVMDSTTVVFQAYDINTAKEVEMRLNGVSLGYVPLTAGKQWGGDVIVSLPSDAIQPAVVNLLEFDHTKNPPSSKPWGVRSVRLGSSPPLAREMPATQESVTAELPSRYHLAQNYPNPFNPITEIMYEVPKKSDLRIAVFDVHGRLVEILVECEVQPGYHQTQFDGSRLSTGVYFLRMEAGAYLATRKMVLAK